MLGGWQTFRKRQIVQLPKYRPWWAFWRKPELEDVEVEFSIDYQVRELKIDVDIIAENGHLRTELKVPTVNEVLWANQQLRVVDPEEPIGV